jgi:hypothetical protein
MSDAEAGQTHDWVNGEKYRSPSFIKRGKCYACGKSENQTEWHHIKPRSEGGKNTRRNLVELCVLCHDDAEANGWGWVAAQYAERHSRNYVSMKRQLPTSQPRVNLNPGETLQFSPTERVWKIWGNDALGIYSVEVGT